MAGRKRATAPREQQSLRAVLFDEDRKRAEAVAVSEDQLAEWFFHQRMAIQAHIEALAGVFDRNLRRAEEERWPDKDDRWKVLWKQDARLMYADNTAQALDRCKHILVCPNHGIKGIEADVDWAGLASRGLLTGEGTMGWMRYCESCEMPALERTIAAQLDLSWRRGTGPPWQKGAPGPFELVTKECEGHE